MRGKYGMGIYLNPGNNAFARIINSGYVDKTGLIGLINESIGTTRNLTCISRPRRFGKSYATQMLCAYYDRTCDSHTLFGRYTIAADRTYEEHINKYHVINLDITGFISEMRKTGESLRDLPMRISAALQNEIRRVCPDINEAENLNDSLIRLVNDTGTKIVFIIDEWDAVIREAYEDEEAQERYLNLLRGWFMNNNFTPQVIAAGYMTGILPIKKDGTQSAISDFREYTMIKPRKFGEYVGFTENEVKDICGKHSISFNSMKQWYDGYDFKGVGSVYNPNSVMQAVDNDDFDSYWTETSAAEGLMEYISKPYGGIAKIMAELIGGVDVKVDTRGFANDLTTFRGEDDVLTLMIHLGYLAYDSEKGVARIPNEEIRREFQKSVRKVEHKATTRRLAESDQLFLDTIQGNEEAVAAQIEKIHSEETSPIHYNREDSLRSVIKLAYYTYKDHYIQWEELPSGEGYADIAYLPKKDSGWPTLIIELKWNESAQGAIDQIRNKRYPEKLQDYGSNLLLVGINYNKKDKKHFCRIERI